MSRMLPRDLVDAREWMVQRWDRVPKVWDNAHLELYEDFAPYTVGAFYETLTMLYRAGSKAPNPGDVLKELTRVQRLRIERGEDTITVDECADHVWAAPDPWDDDRRMTCSVCGAQGAEYRCRRHVYRAGACCYCGRTQPAGHEASDPEPEPVGARHAAQQLGLDDDEAPF